VTVAPQEGYGEIIPELIQTIDKAAFEGVDSLEAGMAFEAQGPSGEVQRVVITEVNGDQVTVDGNHPLAGVTLNFDVKIISVRDATAEEIEHGHVH
jgi:FKBP-type peptidyl-prolyl cis-trans isomerase SlyD